MSSTHYGGIARPGRASRLGCVLFIAGLFAGIMAGCGEKQETGIVALTSIPNRAIVVYKGDTVAITPANIRLPAGVQQVRFEAPDHQPAILMVDVIPGSLSVIETVALTPTWITDPDPEDMMEPEPEPEAESGRWQTLADLPSPRDGHAMVALRNSIYAIGGFDYDQFPIPMANVDRYDPSSNTWTAVAPLSRPRHSFAAAVAGGRIFAIGGYLEGEVLATLERYNPMRDEWTRLADMPTPRHGLTAVAIGGRIYAIGGFDGIMPVNVIESYNPEFDEWTREESLPLARTACAAIANERDIIVLGGQNTEGPTAMVDVYESGPDAWTRMSDFTIPRYGHGAGMIDGKLYVVGGQYNEPVEELEVYKDGMWWLGPPLPQPRAGAAVCVLDRALYVSGGQLDGERVTTFQRYIPDVAAGDYPEGDVLAAPETVSEAWQRLASLKSTPRSGHASVSIDGMLYVVGGYVVEDGEHSWLDLVERYNPAKDEWDQLSPMPTIRESFAAASYAGMIFVAGGLSVPDEVSIQDLLATAEVYDPTTDSWSPIPDMGVPRQWATGAAADESFWVVGGRDEYAVSSVVEQYSIPINMWERLPDMPTSRCGCGVEIINGCLYVAGGTNVTEAVPTLERYVPPTGAWERLPDMHHARADFATGVIDGKLYVVGGMSESYVPSMEVFDPETNTWTDLGPMPEPRAFTAASVIDRKLYISGGRGEDGWADRLDRYDPDLEVYRGNPEEVGI